MVCGTVPKDLQLRGCASEDAVVFCLSSAPRGSTSSLNAVSRKTNGSPQRSPRCVQTPSRQQTPTRQETPERQQSPMCRQTPSRQQTPTRQLTPLRQEASKCQRSSPHTPRQGSSGEERMSPVRMKSPRATKQEDFCRVALARPEQQQYEQPQRMLLAAAPRAASCEDLRAQLAGMPREDLQKLLSTLPREHVAGALSIGRMAAALGA